MTTEKPFDTKHPKCDCPLNCRYCGRRRSSDQVGHYCKTRNCQWQHGYSTCRGKVKVLNDSREKLIASIGKHKTSERKA